MIDEVDCDKIVQYRANMAVKAALKQPNSLEVDIIDIDRDEEVEAVILDNSIRDALPPHLIEYYDKLISGQKIPPNIKKQIRDIVTEIINNA
jgi:hypothetical protein